MKKITTITGAISFALFTLFTGGGNSGAYEKIVETKENNDAIASPINAKHVSNINVSIKNKPELTFEQLYPVLKKSLLEEICEDYRPYRIEEESNSLSVYSQESDLFLSSWEWNLKDQPLLVKDIDNDGVIDYTIELSNAGGGCGGQMGQSERWTFFGSKPDRFIWTHTIPYRSSTGKWEKN
jgi:hypothetical protein